MLRRNCVLAVLCIEATIVGITDGLAADQNTEAPYPNIHASTNSSVIARGRYLALHVGVCGHCHSATNGAPGPDGEVQLSGMAAQPMTLPTMIRFDGTPPGGPNGPPTGAAFGAGPGGPPAGGPPAGAGLGFAPNITSDLKTGIGALSDGAIARALRYGVAHDGRKIGIMNFAFSDEDLTAVVSYLRATKPVQHEVQRVEFNAAGFGPPGNTVERSPPLKRSPRGISVENGRYLVESVGDCAGCHSPRDMRTGQAGFPFGGGMSFPGEASFLAPPNITSGGRLASWSENDFVARFRAGLLLEGSRMPWIAYQGMHEDDVRSIYRYLKSLPAVHTPVADNE